LTRRVAGKTANASGGNLATLFPRQEEFYCDVFSEPSDTEAELASRAESGVTVGVKTCQTPLLDHRFEVRRRCRKLHRT
jgi:hypothetical protein